MSIIFFWLYRQYSVYTSLKFDSSGESMQKIKGKKNQEKEKMEKKTDYAYEIHPNTHKTFNMLTNVIKTTTFQITLCFLVTRAEQQQHEQQQRKKN